MFYIDKTSFQKSLKKQFHLSKYVRILNMKSTNNKISRSFLILTLLLVVFGFFIFSSASLGILARNEVKFSSVAFNQIFYGLFLGSIACFFVSKIDYHVWKKYSFLLLIFGIILTLLVFVPKIGFEHGGAKRWIDLGFISFQPAEFLKISFIVYLSSWLSKIKNKAETFRWGLMPFIIMISIIGLILLLQPDTDSFAVILFASLSMYIVSGANWKHILYILISGFILVALLASTRPYIKQRIEVMLNPSLNSQTSGYQLKQSMIAIGSGGLFGRGFGQSIQKFQYLPEPIGDSVFAVAGEEFGFVGTVIIITLFILFGMEGLKISSSSKDDFGKFLAIGIIVMIVSQAFLNISGMLGILPLTGIPLPFISHGGTALFITLIEVGIVMNISKMNKKLELKK